MIGQIETITYCNHRCWYCQNAHYPVPKPRVMGLTLFENIIEQISTVYPKDELSVISFAAYNEPTLDPYFQKRLKVLTESGFKYWFISNASQMTWDLTDYMIKEKIAVYGFLFNVPAIDPDQFQAAVNVPARKIYAIRENLIYLLKRRHKLNADVTIIVHGDQSRMHQHNFQRMRSFFENYSVNVVYGPVMNRAGMLDTVTHQKIDHQTDKLICRADYFDNIYIGVNANLYLCCHDYYQRYSYGNLSDASLKKLLTSKKRCKEELRFKRDFCRFCPFAQPACSGKSV